MPVIDPGESHKMNEWQSQSAVPFVIPTYEVVI